MATKKQSPGPSVKDSDVYKALRDDGASKQKAARIANASARDGRSKVGRRGGKAGDYEDMTKEELYDRAKKVGVKGRSSMGKSKLISTLRNS